MTEMPSTQDSLLVRTDFTDQGAWEATAMAAIAENAEGFRAYLTLVDDPGWGGQAWEHVRAAARACAEHASVLFIADARSLVNDHPILVVDLEEPPRTPFRCAASELSGVENNLNIANMDWEEFSDNVDADGVFRGFS